ncbi:MAG: phage terminase small subunit P27 family [Methylobacterium mesophilicum]|nr:phage terminase small subunit P27 family [Methylobacterium mesophilicum]
MTHLRGAKPTLQQDRNPIATVSNAPSWLSADAKKEWRRIMPALVERKILTEADMGSVENYCVAVGRVREIEKLLRKGIDPKLFRMQDQAIKTARQLAAELGLTPVSRSRPAMRDDEDSEEDDNPLMVGRGR